jgi:hypothetical protein
VQPDSGRHARALTLRLVAESLMALFEQATREEKHGTADPLSSVTRGLKRNLMIVGLLAVTYKGFDVTIEKIPASTIGVAIHWDERVFTFVLLAMLLYMLLAFALSYYIDMRNWDKTKHQKRTEQDYMRSVAGFASRYEKRILELVKPLVPADVNIGLAISQMGSNIERKAVTPDYRRRIRQREFVISLYKLSKVPAGRSGKNIDLGRDDHKELYEKIDAIVWRFWRRYSARRMLHKIALLPRLWAVRSAYGVRNYVLDGWLPISLGVIAIRGLLNVIPLRWLQHLVPGQ